MISNNTRSNFYYCKGWDFSKISGRPSIQVTTRVCFVTTEVYRMYLALSPCGMELQAFVHNENKWVKSQLVSRVTVPSFEDITKDEDTLSKTMTSLLYIQFPKAEESYYAELPKADEVLSKLRMNPKVAELRSNFYVFNTKYPHSVNHSEGIITVNVEEGNLVIPFFVDEDGETILNVESSSIKLDSRLTFLFNKFGDIVDFVAGKMYLFSWITFRRFVEDKYRMGVQ